MTMLKLEYKRFKSRIKSLPKTKTMKISKKERLIEEEREFMNFSNQGKIVDDEIKEFNRIALSAEDINDLLEWWTMQKKLPVLCVIARRFLSIPASSASIERVFSLSGNTFKRRSQK